MGEKTTEEDSLEHTKEHSPVDEAIEDPNHSSILTDNRRNSHANPKNNNSLAAVSSNKRAAAI